MREGKRAPVPFFSISFHLEVDFIGVLIGELLFKLFEFLSFVSLVMVRLLFSFNRSL